MDVTRPCFLQLDKMLSAMRYEFGGHVERPTGG
jgi:6-phosphogluconate dehydrogenase (decarboxylating)